MIKYTRLPPGPPEAVLGIKVGTVPNTFLWITYNYLPCGSYPIYHVEY